MDPVDECFKDLFSDVIKSNFPDEDVETLHDFEMRKISSGSTSASETSFIEIPKMLVQTAGHVAGYVYYYQQKDVQPYPWDKDKKMFGVSLRRLVCVSWRADIQELARSRTEAKRSSGLRLQLRETEGAFAGVQL